MRLYPPVWMLGRQAAEADTVGGYTIPKGAYVYMSQWVVQRRDDLWKNPEVFDPERFMPAGVDARKALGQPRYAYFPFSGGKRQCIGDHFARMEAAIITSMVMRHFDLSLVPGTRVVPDPSITLRPAGGLPMTITPRHSAG